MAENDAAAPVVDLNETESDPIVDVEDTTAEPAPGMNETFPVEVIFDTPESRREEAALNETAPAALPSERRERQPMGPRPRPTVDLVETVGVSFKPRRVPVREPPVIVSRPLKQSLKHWAKYKAREQGDEPSPYKMMIDDGGQGVLLHCYKCRCPEGSETICAKLDKFTGNVKVQLNSAARTCCSEFLDQCTVLNESIALVDEIIEEVQAYHEDLEDSLARRPLLTEERYLLYTEAGAFIDSLKGRLVDDDDPEVAVVLDAFVDSFYR